MKRNNLCIDFLTNGHRVNKCKSTFGCSVCKLNHHSLLHREVSGAVRSNSDVQNCFADTPKQVFLGTAVVGIYHRGQAFKARALIDSGSQATFISMRLQEKLRLPAVQMNARVSGLNSTSSGTVQGQCSFVLTSHLDDRISVKATGLALSKLTSKLTNSTADVFTSAAFSGISLADPKFDKGDYIDILISGDIYPDILMECVKNNMLGDLVAQESIFCWIVTGPLPALHSKEFSTYTSGYARKEVNRKSKRIVKPNHRGHELL